MENLDSVGRGLLKSAIDTSSLQQVDKIENRLNMFQTNRGKTLAELGLLDGECDEIKKFANFIEDSSKSKEEKLD